MTTDIFTDPLMTVAEVAKIFEVQPRTIREWLKADTMHGSKLPTGGWRIPTSEVHRFANEKYGD